MSVMSLDAFNAVLRLCVRITRDSGALANEFVMAGGVAAVMHARYASSAMQTTAPASILGLLLNHPFIAIDVFIWVDVTAVSERERANAACVRSLMTLLIRNVIEDNSTMTHTMEKVVRAIGHTRTDNNPQRRVSEISENYKLQTYRCNGGTPIIVMGNELVQTTSSRCAH
jgi:hypothetical protein